MDVFYFWDEMQKDEIIQLHILFLNIKEKIERLLHDTTLFEEYRKLGILPTEVHRTKEEHKKAVLLLAKKFALILSDEKNSELERIAERLEKMLNKDTVIKRFPP